MATSATAVKIPEAMLKATVAAVSRGEARHARARARTTRPGSRPAMRVHPVRMISWSWRYHWGAANSGSSSPVAAPLPLVFFSAPAFLDRTRTSAQSTPPR